MSEFLEISYQFDFISDVIPDLHMLITIPPENPIFYKMWSP